MDVKRINSEEAKRLVDEEGFQVVDVRSIPEFEVDHVAGSYNIPYLHKMPQGMAPNAAFAQMIEKHFPDTQSKLIMACEMGARSLRAAAELKNRGYANVMDLSGGIDGHRDRQGSVLEKGWRDFGFPMEKGAGGEKSYASLGGELPQVAAAPAAPAPLPKPPSASLPGLEVEGMNRFASNTRKVHCRLLDKELPGLKRRPYPGELGERIFNEVSAVAWNRWVEHSKMIINEYRINSSDQAAMSFLMEQCESFFFGEGAKLPEGFVPQARSK